MKPRDNKPMIKNPQCQELFNRSMPISQSTVDSVTPFSGQSNQCNYAGNGTFARMNKNNRFETQFSTHQSTNPFMSGWDDVTIPSKYVDIKQRTIVAIKRPKDKQKPIKFKKFQDEQPESKFQTRMKKICLRYPKAIPEAINSCASIERENFFSSFNELAMRTLNLPVKKMHVEPSENQPNRISLASKYKIREFKVFSKDEQCLLNSKKFTSLLKPVNKDEDYETGDSDLEYGKKKTMDDLYNGFLHTLRRTRTIRSSSCENTKTVSKPRSASEMMSPSKTSK